MVGGLAHELDRARARERHEAVERLRGPALASCASSVPRERERAAEAPAGIGDRLGQDRVHGEVAALGHALDDEPVQRVVEVFLRPVVRPTSS